MLHHDKSEFIKQVSEKLQSQLQKRGIYHGIDTRDAEPSVIKGLLDNPDLARDLLSPHLDIDNLSRFALTCRHANSIFRPLLPLSRAAHYVVVKPSVIEIKKILEGLDPASLKLFLQRTVKKVIDQSDRTLVNNTLFQLAYGAGDDEMCRVFEPYFEKAFGSSDEGKAEMSRQLNEKFPEGSEEEKKQHEAKDLAIKNKLAELLEAVTKAISNEKFNQGKDENGRWILSEATQNEIAVFIKGFDLLHPTFIEMGPHYRSQSTLEAYEAYSRASGLWHYRYKKTALFEDSVLAKVLAHSPANDAMRFSQGLYFLQQTPPAVFKRTLVTGQAKHFYTQLHNQSADFCLSGAVVNILNVGYHSAVPALQAHFSNKTSALTALRQECTTAEKRLESASRGNR